MFEIKLPICNCAYCSRQNSAVLAGLFNLMTTVRWLVRPPMLGYVPIEDPRE